MSLEHKVPPVPGKEEHVPTGWERWSELLVAIGLLVLGVVILLGSRDIRVTVGTTVSPRLVPQVVGIAALAVGAWYLIDIIRAPHAISGGEDSEDVDIDAPTNWRALVIIGIGLTIFAIAVRPLGFSLAAAIMFTVSAFGMGSNKHAVNAAIGLVLGVVVFLVFDTWLGVRLPAGILEDVMP